MLKPVASIVAQYAFDFSEITSRTAKHEIANLTALCQTAYNECFADKFLRKLHKSLGEKGLTELVELVKTKNQTNPALQFSSPRQAVQVSSPAEQPREEATSSPSNAQKEEELTQTTKPN